MDEIEDIIEIRIQFERGVGDPARVFRAMTGLIESTQHLDDHLSATISAKVKTSLILQADIHKLAEESDIKLLPAYAPVETGTLLADISLVNAALENLEENDRAIYTSSEGQSTYNQNLSISESIVREIVTRETMIRNEAS